MADIAIIGLAGRFPGSKDVEEFWKNLCEGRETTKFFTKDELRLAGVSDELLNDPDYVCASPVLEGVDLFDAEFFGYSRREAEFMDPQQRIFLECASEAIESSGYSSENYAGSIGTFAGILGFRNLAEYSFREQLAAWGSLIVLLVIAPHFLGEYTLFRIGLVASMSVTVIGMDLLFGQCGIISLGQSGFLMTSGFMAAWLTNGTFGIQLPVLISVFFGALFNGVLGLVLGLPALRVKDDYLVIVSLSLTLAIPLILKSQYLEKYAGLNEGGLFLKDLKAPDFISWMQPHVYRYFLVLIPALILIFIAYNLIHHSQVGRALRTIKCDKEVSMIIGIPAVRYKLLAFVMSAIYFGFGGGFMFILTQNISSYSYEVSNSLDFLFANVIGGPGSILGSIVGGSFLVFQPDLTQFVAQHVTGGKALIQCGYGVALILIVYFLPGGLASETTAWLKSKVWARSRRGAFQMAPPLDYDYIADKKNYFPTSSSSTTPTPPPG